MTVLGLLKSGKLRLRHTIVQGDLIKLVGELHKKFDLSRPQNLTMGNDETELQLSVESRSFVNRVNDQVRRRQKRISNVAGDGEEHSMIWGMFMAVTLESAVFMGKNFQNNQNSIVNTADLSHTEANVRHICEISGRTR